MPATADPCKAIPDKGLMPADLAAGRSFSGPVVYIGDGDSLCVDVGGRGPESWVEVRLADFYARELREAGDPQAKGTLARIVGGRRVTCVAHHRT